MKISKTFWKPEFFKKKNSEIFENLPKYFRKFQKCFLNNFGNFLEFSGFKIHAVNKNDSCHLNWYVDA